ncbi:MAG: hypothetical protein J5I98_27470 [Phaeodactylibacter sp.]|nr:hypothetical protein [Phaeodactylibacter sp.]
MAYLFAGLASLLAVTIFRIGKQIWATYQCPGTAALYDFWFDRMDKASREYRNVITHLGHCEQCQEELRHIRKGKPLEDHLVE